MTISHEGFLRAIRETPDDDTPRLIYADWLDDHGEPERAEFIRLQIELANPDLGTDRAFVNRLREGELLSSHAEQWRQPFADSLKPAFTRGFVSSLTMTARGLSHYGRRYFAAAPIDRVTFTYTQENDAAFYTKLAGRDFLASLRTLDTYQSPLGEDAARVLFDSPHLTKLRGLHLGEGDTTPGMVQVLAERLHRLRELWLWDFHQGELGDEGLSFLANNEAFGGLTTLDLLNNGLTATGARALAGSPYLRRLESLSFGIQACGYANNRIGADGVNALAQSPQLAGLRHLGFGVTAIGDAGVRELAASPYWRRLRSLNLPLIELTDAGVQALARSPCLASVTWLNLSSNRIGTAGVQALAESPVLGELRWLGLWGNVLDSAAVDVMLGDNRFAQLHELYVGGCRWAEGDRERLQARFGSRVRL